MNPINTQAHQQMLYHQFLTMRWVRLSAITRQIKLEDSPELDQLQLLLLRTPLACRVLE